MDAKPNIRGSFAGVLFRLIVVIFCLSTWKSPTVLAQDSTSRKNDCSAVDHPAALKAVKLMSGAYSDEAMQKKADGKVVVCVTVDGYGKVTNVSPVSGPPELLQSSIDAAKQCQFNPPAKAPVSTKMEFRYNLTGVCPEGGSDAGEITVDMRPDLQGERADALKILGNDVRPLPEYPEIARSQRRRGQLYLSLVVNPDGTVSDVKVVKSLDELLDRLALETVRTWKFNVSPGGTATMFFLTLSYRIPCYDRT